MYAIKLNDKVYDRVPESASEVSMRRFMQLRTFDVREPLALIKWAIDDETIMLKDTAQVEREIAGLLALVDPVIAEVFDFMASKSKNDTPKTVKVMGQPLELRPGLLDDLPWWPFVVAKTIIAEESDKHLKAGGDIKKLDVTDRLPEVVAHYIYTAATGRTYTEAAAGKFVDAVLDMPFMPVIQLGNFFLRKLEKRRK